LPASEPPNSTNLSESRKTQY